MTIDIQDLDEERVVKALSLVAKKWIENEGMEFYENFEYVRYTAGKRYDELPAWATSMPQVTPESAEFAREMLKILINAKDEKYRVWTNEALDEVQGAVAQELAMIALTGAIIIGAVLAARVEKIEFSEGSIQIIWYEGIPEGLSDVLNLVRG